MTEKLYKKPRFGLRPDMLQIIALMKQAAVNCSSAREYDYLINFTDSSFFLIRSFNDSSLQIVRDHFVLQ